MTLYDFETQKETVVPFHAIDGVAGGHAGGDAGIVKAIYDYLVDGLARKQIPSIEESCHNHMLVFAAEESRAIGQVVDVDAFMRKTML